MGAPAIPRKRRGRAAEANPAPSTPATAKQLHHQNTAAEDAFDFDRRVVDQVDTSIWRAVYNGEFRLAVRCKCCQRWLTDGRSKRAHLGPRCAAKVVDR